MCCCSLRTSRFFILFKLFLLLQFHFLLHSHFLKSNVWVLCLSWFINHLNNSFLFRRIWVLFCCWWSLSSLYSFRFLLSIINFLCFFLKLLVLKLFLLCFNALRVFHVGSFQCIFKFLIYCRNKLANVLYS